MSTMPEPALPRHDRLVSMDVFRGFVMLLMAAELMALPEVAAHFPDSSFWQFIARHTSHVEWTGCSLHDLIQPAFTFLVGVALPFSLAARLARGQGTGRLWAHALWRSLLLVLLGVFLRSIGSPITQWTFEDTLSQIGLGYPFLFARGFAGVRVRWGALLVVLVGCWLVFAAFPLPPADFDYAAVNVPPDWPHHFAGFAAHWNLNSNAAWAFDVWFLNLFPREFLFVGNAGGYSTLSFIPTLGTMILGLIAGGWLKAATEAPPISADRAERAATSGSKDSAQMAAVMKLIYAGMGCILLGWLLHVSGVCPIVKKLWTPAWTLFSGGWCFLLMAGFYLVVEIQGWRRWAFPLVVIGMNSIAMYVLVHTMPGFLRGTLHTHLGSALFQSWGEAFVPLLEGGVILLMLWLVLLWMHRRKLYLRV